MTLNCKDTERKKKKFREISPTCPKQPRAKIAKPGLDPVKVGIEKRREPAVSPGSVSAMRIELEVNTGVGGPPNIRKDEIK